MLCNAIYKGEFPNDILLRITADIFQEFHLEAITAEDFYLSY